jgi:hypothetical protein
MQRTYFEPKNFQALAWVFQEAHLILENRNEADPATLDFVAHRIFVLASNGMTPGLILANVLNTKVANFEASSAQSRASASAGFVRSSRSSA